MTPIVEPEVLMDGNHSLMQCAEATQRVLESLFIELEKQEVDLKGLILKVNMALPGKDSTEQKSLKEVADATLKILEKCVPASVAGIVFLSGGQSSELATARLNEMHNPIRAGLPWPLSFSFSRALQFPAMEIWKGAEKNRTKAQDALCFRAKCNCEARQGIYKASEEYYRAKAV
jgi:fructose-bisphosphate aldolase class I